LRTVYLGTSEFAAAVLRDLALGPHRPRLVLTRPDRPAGRGRKLTAPPVAEVARELELELAQPQSVNDADSLELIDSVAPEAVCVCAFGALIKEPLLSRYRMLNVHPSLLPRWRGAAPIERAIMAGDEFAGVSIMGVIEELDAGPVCAQERVRIGPEDTYGSLASRLQELGAALLVHALEHDPPFVEQDGAQATYAEKIASADRRLDPGRPAAELERVVRALHPHIGAQLSLADGELLGVKEARAVPGDGLREGALSLDGGLPVLGCASGALELVRVQPAGGRPMSGEDYLRGHRR
jgi:methionyl-tRNA formyltransferase